MMQVNAWEQYLVGSVYWSDRIVTLALDGELGAKELEAVKHELFRLAHRGCVGVVLDLTEVTHLDYRGVRPLLARADLFRGAGGDIKLAGASPYLQAIFRAAGAYEGFEVYPTAQKARAAFHR